MGWICVNTHVLYDYSSHGCRMQKLMLFCFFLHRILASGSLVLLSPSTEDEGYFECTAVNDVGEERRVIEVMVQGIDIVLSFYP